MPDSKSSERPTFFVSYSGGQRGLSDHASLEDAKDAAWALRRAGKLRPVEILDRARPEVEAGTTDWILNNV